MEFEKLNGRRVFKIFKLGVSRRYETTASFHIHQPRLCTVSILLRVPETGFIHKFSSVFN
jgi:hypothetical protein